MTDRIRRTFAVLAGTGRAFRFSADPERGLLAANVAIVTFGFWCIAWPVRRDWRVAPALVWGWIVVASGVLHLLAALAFRRYIAGVITAPLLLVVALRLARLLRRL